MSTARAQILAAIRSATAGPDARAWRERSAARAAPAGARAEGAGSIDLLARRVAEYRAAVTFASRDRVGMAVAEILDRHRARRIAMPRDIPTGWTPETCQPVVDEPPLSGAELDAVDGVLTGAACAIAETGTIVLDGGAGQGRRALSLIPDLHVCVVDAHQIVTTLADALTRIDVAARPVTFVSGPSATVDIELNRVEGVHGPRRLEVVLVAARSTRETR